MVLTVRHEPARRWHLVVLLGGAVLYLVFIGRTVFTYHGHLVGTLFDDALISLRYAHNLIDGHGLVWNVGEQPPVEGYSNLAWTLVMSAALLVSSTTIAPIVVSALGAASLLACGLTARRILRQIGAPPSMQIAGSAIVLTYYPLVFWTLRGMEVGLLAWLLLLAVERALRPSTQGTTSASRDLTLLSALAGVAFLTRNDSAIVFAIVLAFAWYERGLRRSASAAIVPFALCIIVQFAFRYAYYHELVPNTYVLKMTGVPPSVRVSRGLDAFAETLAPLACLTSIAAAAALAEATPRPIRRLLCLGLALVAAQSGYLIWIGGDAWDFDHSNRFAATVLPVLLTGIAAAAPFATRVLDRKRSAIALLVFGALCIDVLVFFPAFDPPSYRTMLAGLFAASALAGSAAVAVRGWPARQTALGMAAVLVAAVVVPSAHSWALWAARNANYVPNDIGVSQLSLVLRDELPSNTVIAAGWLGAPAYFTGLQAIDIFGKTDKHIARVAPTGPFRPGHNKEDLGYSVGRLRPEVVLILLDRPEVESYGYVRVGQGMYVRRDVATSDWVAAAFPDSARPAAHP
jgi:hypothetical protein